MILIKLFLTCLLILASTLSFSEDSVDAVIISAGVNQATAKTGDIVRFQIKLEFDKSIQDLIIPEVGGDIVGFRIINSGNSGPDEITENRLQLKRWYELQGDFAGSYILPAIEIKYENLRGVSKTVKTSEIFVEIKSSLVSDKDKKESEGSKDIRDIKDIVEAPRYLSTLSIVLIVVLLLLVGGFFVGRLYSNRSHLIEKVVLPPHVVALKSLDKLGNSKALDHNLKKFHFDLSEIIRVYFEGRYDITTTDMTTFEIRVKLVNIDQVLESLKKEFLFVLEQTDMVKFADVKIDREISLSLMDQARRFVEETKPIAEITEKEDSSETGRDDFI